MELIRINEEIVLNYDSKLLCEDFDNAKCNLKKLYDRKKEILKSLEATFNEFFNLKSNFITRKLKIASFALIPTLIGYELKFNIPKTVDKSSRQYFCYVNLMDRLVREFDVISLQKDGYYILDISASLNLEKLFEGD